jgi:hypothetical protein
MTSSKLLLEDTYLLIYTQYQEFWYPKSIHSSSSVVVHLCSNKQYLNSGALLMIKSACISVPFIGIVSVLIIPSDIEVNDYLCLVLQGDDISQLLPMINHIMCA